MNMEEVTTLVNTNRGNGKKENLDRMLLLMEKLGNPQNQLKFVHIAGTNGKGTTASFIASILKEAGLRIGLFTSPHLEVLNERIQIDQQHISDEDFIASTEKVARYVDVVEKELGEKLYSFEILTAVAFVYFSQQVCDLIVLETGIGGRLDSTNVIHTPEVAVITSIGLDHMNMLGDTVDKIAKEKAGTIKANGTAIVYDCEEVIRSVFEEKAKHEQAKLTIIDQESIQVIATSVKEQRFHYKDLHDLVIHMIGDHQLSNATLAIETALTLSEQYEAIDEEAIRGGLNKAFWAGRMETLQEQPLVLVDGAHNEQGVKALSQNIRTLFPDQQVTFIVGMMKDKGYMDMISEVKDLASKILTVSPDPWRGFDAEEVANQLEKTGISAQALTSVDAVKAYIASAGTEEIIIVFGSLYLVGDLRKQFSH
ncbi:bifunctional folylpolyglutamate synthase/dihydrofolate synthase [Marinilactibacillus kalidii]|uniref:bifunctional folylpolyglutamate synthase/dihydrofolate synthase n=1 Tax=Marinilactibacillus kalidii TaxID=2820274 RepID=UPI001ABEDEA6|nr:folylpolyglutamate synthase/dihydrofolate synthase family protein [Marinilactibacillus kalidii]